MRNSGGLPDADQVHPRRRKVTTKAERVGIDRATLTERVYTSLRQDLLAGTHAPGTRLNEREVAAQLGVSPTPVREALNKLRSEGLLEYRPWVGTVVVEFGPRDILHLSDIRLYLERLAVRETGSRLDVAGLARLWALHDAYRSAAGQAGPGAHEVEEANEAFHGFFFEKSGNPWLQQMYASLSSLLVLARRPLSARRTGSESIPEHEAIVQALERHDVDGAELAMHTHLFRVRDALLQEVGPGED